jgi:hypothetical protein
VNPGAIEICNAIDDVCDASIDEDLPLFTFYADADGDTYGDPAAPVQNCSGVAPPGHVANSLDCNDASALAYPGGLEICDGLDSDCDGSTDELTGDRFVAPGGVDGADACINSAAPCATITYAARVACLGETVRVAEGEYVEDVLIDRAVSVASQGIALYTQLRGTGASDVLQIMASGVRWNGIEVGRTPGRACLRIGSAAVPGLRDVDVSNAALYGCRVGAVIDSTGTPAGEGGWNRLLGVDVRENVADGTPDSGVGILVTGGNGRLEIKTGRLVNNAGPGLRIAAPPSGAENRSIVVAGEYIHGNGLDAIADGRAGIEAHEAFDLRLEGNDFVGQAGLSAPDDGIGAVLDAITGGTVYCNRIRQNEGGVSVLGGSSGIDVRQNQVRGNSVFGVRVASGALAGMSARENIFAGNALALDNLDPAALDARRSWWNAADGSSTAGGSGDAFSGNVLAGDIIARASAPLLVRAPSDSGWDPSVDSCFQSIQQAHDAGAPGDFVLVGPGVYFSRTLLTKPLEIEGVATPGDCSPSVMSTPQDGGSHLPNFRASGVLGLVVRQLTIRDAGLGTPCGEASGDEVGLDLLDVSQSSFRDICLKQNGVTELRVRGNSDGNVFQNVTIDGVIRTVSGEDVCGHRAREGVLVDGWSACEGGAGASADGNAFRGFTIGGVTRGAVVRLASGTEVSGSTIDVSRAAAWDGGGYAAGVLVEMADDTLIATNSMTSAEQNDGIRISGRTVGSCIAERNDALRTTVSGNTIRHATFAGVRNYRNGPSSGAPRGTVVTCNTIRECANGLLADFVGVGADAAVAHQNDFVANSVGVRNIAVDLLDATSNWWGATNGPGGAGSGNGDAVFGSVTFGGWLGSSGQDDGDADGISECGGDCDDRNGVVFPGGRERCADGIDNNCDGEADLGDEFCTALAVDQLWFTAPSRTTLAWNPASGATTYGVQRGMIGPGPWGGYDHGCIASQLAAPTTQDPAVPAAGRAFYYLATGQVADTFGVANGPLGVASSGAPRPESTIQPCP